jgi:hypothetical protein
MLCPVAIFPEVRHPKYLVRRYACIYTYILYEIWITRKPVLNEYILWFREYSVKIYIK